MDQKLCAFFCVLYPQIVAYFTWKNSSHVALCVCVVNVIVFIFDLVVRGSSQLNMKDNRITHILLSPIFHFISKTPKFVKCFFFVVVSMETECSINCIPQKSSSNFGAAIPLASEKRVRFCSFNSLSFQ